MTQVPEWKQWRFPRSMQEGVPPTDSVMLKNQPALPKLPVPPLDDTLHRLIDSARAIAKSNDELSQLEAKVDEFRKSGLADTLQRRLEQRRDTERSWIAEWWDTDAYMAYRDSVVINVSYYFGYSDLPQKPQGPAAVAAAIASKALDFRESIYTGELVPEKVGKDELCMESYKWAFNTCRVPSVPSDHAVKTSETAPESQHFVVIKDNAFYSIPFVDATTKKRLDTATLQKAIQSVIDSAPADGALPVGVLTGINRDTWAHAHKHLASDPANRRVLDKIESSAFVIALDSNDAGVGSTKQIVDLSYCVWRSPEGNEGNRWWDKPLQFVVFKNGHAGFVGEHSCMDGTPTARMNQYITSELIAGKSPDSSSDRSSTVPAVESLPFKFDSQSKEAIESGLAEFRKHVEPYRIHYLSYKRYGKDGIKACGFSPDAWVQMVMQLAYYLTHGSSCATYEAAQVRKYQLGRTETVRVCTNESVAFVTGITDSSLSVDEKKERFAKAVKKHGFDMKSASNAHGIDRHLYGLRKSLTSSDSAPALFSDPLFQRSATWTMSTSQIYLRHSEAYGWGMVVPGGYGFPYMIHPESLQFTVTCDDQTPGDEMVANLEKAADMLMDLYSGGAGNNKSGKL